MKLIELTQGKFTQVDDEDYGLLMQWKWQASNCGNEIFYAVRSSSRKIKPRKLIMMHRFIMQLVDKNIYVDHIDHNGLNNQKSNLRLATRRQNNANRRSKKNGASKYLGVSIIYPNDLNRMKKIRYISQINGPGGKIHLGSFDSEEEAALEYDKMAKKLHGEFSNFNFK